MINTYNVKQYCRDDISKIENYEQAINDKVNKWVCHHRLELTLDGEEALSKAELKRMNMYYHRPYFELIFMKDVDHRKLHSRFVKNWRTEESINKFRYNRLGHSFTEESRKKISETVKQRWKEGVYDLKCHTPEHNKHISESRKGKPHPTNRKIWNPVTEFGKKYRERYGIKKRDNLHLWNQEYGYYRRTGKIRWENK